MARATAKDVILEILRVTDGEWTGKTKLFKAFYFAHLYYAQERPDLLTDWPIVKMPTGPGIHESHRLFGDLIREGLLVVESVHEGPYPEHRYRLTEAGRKAQRLPDDQARLAVEKAALFCHVKTAEELTQMTHERSRSWQEGEDGAALNVEVDVIPDDEYEARKAEFTRLSGVISEVLGSNGA